MEYTKEITYVKDGIEKTEKVIFTADCYWSYGKVDEVRLGGEVNWDESLYPAEVNATLTAKELGWWEKLEGEILDYYAEL